jgi:hypothetical protein
MLPFFYRLAHPGSTESASNRQRPSDARSKAKSREGGGAKAAKVKAQEAYVMRWTTKTNVSELVDLLMENSILLETKARGIFRIHISVHFLINIISVISRYALKMNALQI